MPESQSTDPAHDPATKSVTGLSPELSIVIPTFNGEAVLDRTIDRVILCLAATGRSHELILVDDGSIDRTWEILQQAAGRYPNVVAVRLRKNYRQHVAIMNGLRVSAGAYVVTMDDDLQHAPEEIEHLVAKAKEGHDVVFAQYRRKHHSLYIRWASALVTWINRRLFRLPSGQVMSAFKLIRRDVVNRMIAREPPDPYIGGLTLMCSSNVGNALVEHYPSVRGRSTYSLARRFRLGLTVLLHTRMVVVRIKLATTVNEKVANERVREIVRSARTLTQ